MSALDSILDDAVQTTAPTGAGGVGPSMGGSTPGGGTAAGGGAGGGDGRTIAAAQAADPRPQPIAECRKDYEMLKVSAGRRTFRQMMEIMLGPHPCYESTKQHVRFVARQVDGWLTAVGPERAVQLAIYQELQRELVVSIALLNRWGPKPSADPSFAAAAETMRFDKLTTAVPGVRMDEFDKLAQNERKSRQTSKSAH